MSKTAIRAFNTTTVTRNTRHGEVQFVGGLAVEFTKAQKDFLLGSFNGKFKEVEISDEVYSQVKTGSYQPSRGTIKKEDTPEIPNFEDTGAETDDAAGVTSEGEFDKIPDGSNYGYLVAFANYHKIEAASKKKDDLLLAVGNWAKEPESEPEPEPEDSENKA